jgi:hypothetical protein
VVVREVDSVSWEKGSEAFNCGLFNTRGWVDSISDGEYGAIFLDFQVNGGIVGKMSGFILKSSRLHGNQLLFYSGPALKTWDATLFENCLNALRLFAIGKGYARIHIRPFDQHLKELVHVKHYFHTVTSEYVVHFENYQNIKVSYGNKQNVKRAKKAGATYFSSQSPEVLDRMLALMDDTRDTRKGKYGQDYNPMFMVNLTRESLTRLLVTGMGVLHGAQIEGVVHSVQLNVELNGKQYGLLMGSDGIAYKNGLASFIDHHIITNAHEAGCRYYNLGLIPPDSQGGAGIRKYKESVGAEEMVSYGYYSYYLTFPWRLLNPLIRLSKKLPENKILNYIRSLVKV